MSVLLPLAVLLGALGLFAWVVLYPRAVCDAWWYGTRYEDALVHVAPPFSVLAIFAAVLKLLDEAAPSFGDRLGLWLAGPVLMPLLVMSVLACFGVRLPPPLVPRWIRERRRREQALRRARREGRDASQRGQVASRPLEHPDLAVTLEVPATWQVDVDDVVRGRVHAADTTAWADGFHPRLSIIQAPLGPEDREAPEAVLQAQRDLEPAVAAGLVDYRPLRLETASVGRAADGAAVPGAVRAAYHAATGPHGAAVPVMMHQWIARHGGVELSLTFTVPAIELPVWSESLTTLAETITWKQARR